MRQYAYCNVRIPGVTNQGAFALPVPSRQAQAQSRNMAGLAAATPSSVALADPATKIRVYAGIPAFRASSKGVRLSARHR